MSDDTVLASSLWYVIPNYDLQSRADATCSISGTTKRPDDIGVFRPATGLGYIEEEGSFDISQAAVEEAAALLGWKSPGECEAAIQRFREKNGKLSAQHATDVARARRLEARIAELELLLEQAK